MVLRLFLAFFFSSFLSHFSFGQTISLLVNDSVILNGSSDSVCINDSTKFNVAYSGVGSNPSFSWNFQGGSPANSLNPLEYVSFGTPGIKTVAVSVFGTDTVSSSINIYVASQLVTSSISYLGNDSLCYLTKPTVMEINITGGIAPYNYSWERKYGSGNWQNIGLDSNIFTETNDLTIATYYRVTVTSSDNCSNMQSEELAIWVYPDVVAPVIDSAQTICFGTQPLNLSRSEASGGDGSYNYLWQYSTSGSANWINTIQSSLNYIPDTLYSDTWYRVYCNTSCGIRYSNVIKVTVNNELNSGTLTPVAPMICYNTSQVLTSTIATGGDGVYTYQWQRRVPTGSSSWQLAPGSFGSTVYNTGLLTQDYEYRVLVSSGCVLVDSSNVSTIDVADELIIPSISNASMDTICYSTSPGQFSIVPTGGRSPYTYQWRKRNFNGLWQNVGTNASVYNDVSSLSSDKEYHVIVTSSNGCGTSTSPSQNVIVRPDVVSSIVSGPAPPATNHICYNTAAFSLTRTDASGSDSVFTYDWEYSVNGTSNWQSTSLNGLTYSPGVLTSTRWFRVKITNQCETVYSNIYDIIVDPPLFAGTLTPVAPMICYNTSQVLTSTIATGGDGVYTYQWQRRSQSGNWNIINNTSTVYNTGNLTQSYDYRITVSNAYCNVFDTSNIASVDVADSLVILNLSLTGLDTICHSTIPGQLIVNAQGGRIPYSYQWERKIGAGSWQNVGSNINSYAETSNLSNNTQYRVNISSSSGCGSVISSLKDVFVRPAITPSTITSSQTICHNTQALYLNRNNASGADGVFQYEWQYSLNGLTNWLNSGFSGLSFDPGILTSSKWYRVRVLNTICNATDYSNVIKINVRNPIYAGAFSTSLIEKCFDTPANLILSSTSGSDSVYNYSWQRKSVTGGWVDDSSSINASSFNTGNLQQSYSYRVIVNSACNIPDTSNILYVDVADPFVKGVININANNDSVCFGSNASSMTTINFSGGRSPYNYLWEKKTSGNPWTSLGLNQPNLQDFDALETDTYYRATVTSDKNCGILIADSIKIRVIPLPGTDSSQIMGPSQVCNNSGSIFYSLSPTYADSISWSLSYGSIISKHGNNIFIDFNDSGIQNTDTLFAFLYSNKTQCNRVIKLPIDISSNRAPEKASIIRKNLSSILICSDSTSGITYQWGYYDRSSGSVMLMPNSNLRYFQYPNSIDTVANLYFVKTDLNGCKTTSFYQFNYQTFGFDNLGEQRFFDIFPNPCSDQFHINGNIENINGVQIISYTGVIWDLDFNSDGNTVQLPSNISAGIYAVRIRTDKKEFITRLMIVK